MPRDHDALIQKGAALHNRGRLIEALACYEEALATDPASLLGHHNRASALLSLKRHEEALAVCETALALKPGYIPALHNRGYLLQALGRHEEAIDCYDRILAVEPNSPRVLFNRGNALQDLSRFEEAIATYDRALAQRAEYHEAQVSKGFALAASGDLREGFLVMEARWELPWMRKFRPNSAKPEWRGGEPIDGKRILLYGEGGLGDCIQFVRYVPLVARQGGYVILKIPPGLRTLFERLEGIGEIVTEGEPLPPHDLRCPLMSLPTAFGTTLETIPTDCPYLEAPADRVAHWKRRLPSGCGRVGGIVWAGNPAFAKDDARSMPLSVLLPYLAANMTWISLQKLIPDRDRSVFEGASQLLSWGEECRDLADTAAQIACVDFVIAVDTALAHLTGALARPVWLILPYASDWRWMRHRTESPWYPSARLFRQTVPGDWFGPLEQVRRHAASEPSMR